MEDPSLCLTREFLFESNQGCLWSGAWRLSLGGLGGPEVSPLYDRPYSNCYSRGM